MVQMEPKEPLTPPRRKHSRQVEASRTLAPVLSDPKEPDLKRRRGKWPAGTAPTKPLVKVDAAEEREFQECLNRSGVPAFSREQLLPFLRRWGSARMAQALALWTFLGDGKTRPVSTSALQVWGPPGTGKTEIVLDFLKGFNIAYVRLDCACLTSLGELHVRLAEQLRRVAVSFAAGEGILPKELEHKISPHSQLRAIDRLDAAVQFPLEFISYRSNNADANASINIDAGKLAECTSKKPIKVVVVLDHSHELQSSRFGDNAIQRLITLPEVLRQGDHLAIVTVGRLPLGSLGLLPARDPPTVAFQSYTPMEVEKLLFTALSNVAATENVVTPPPSAAELRTLCNSGLMKFAVPFLGCNLHHLLRIGEEVLHSPGGMGKSMAALQQQIEKSLQQRIGLPDITGLDETKTFATVTRQQMTRAEIRLILAAYLGAHIDKDEDVQLFCPKAKRRRRMAAKRGPQHNENLPIFAQAPRPIPLTRLFAIYHHLAGQPQLLGPTLFASLTSLCEAGLLSFPGSRCNPASIDQDTKIICRAELPFVRECAGELNVDLAEYICKY